MRLSLTKLENITMTIIMIPLTLSPLDLISLVRLGGYGYVHGRGHPAILQTSKS
jgi:hypothetical protein